MLWLIRWFFNQNKIRQLSAEWHTMHDEAEWMLRLNRAALEMADFYIAKGRYASARVMLDRGIARRKYAEVLIDQCKTNTAEYVRLTK